ncbi:MAG: carbohydrate-binding protein, partial [Cytophagaceae bacterium]
MKKLFMPLAKAAPCTMRSWRIVCILLFLLMNVQLVFAQFKVIGYLPTWGGNLADVQYTKLTHINYAFLIPTATGGYQAPDDPTRLQNLVSQAHANGVKVIISVGGGGGGDAFRTIVPNASYRTAFVNNMLNFVNQYNLDGVDIDWEFPSTGTEANNFLLLMQQLYTTMHNNGKLCTAAVVAYGGTSILNGVFNAVDFLNIMAYDENSYDHSTYDLAVKSVNYWIGVGLPASKAVLGVPFYGRDNCCAYKTVDYAAILAMGGSPNADTYNNQIGYNGIPTMKKKTSYAMQACGGIMIWSIDTDAKGTYSLLSAINEVVVANSNPVPDNLAKGKVVIVSSSESNANVSTAGSNATDGSYNTRWSSLFADPQWLSVDLGVNYSINRVKLTWEAAYATAYQIQTSTDGTNWTTIKSVTGNATTTNDNTGLSGIGRYIRIYGTARATAYGYSLYELEVYGTGIESPYNGTPISLPGKIEAENYDLGGEGLAYHDAEAANQGGAYRTDGVDIQATTDAGGGYNIGYTSDGEWMKYMVNVPVAGTYNFGFRTAGTGTASAIRLEVDGADVTGSIALPNTGAWQTWASTVSPNVFLSAGQHTIRVFVVTGGFNLNYINVISANQPPVISLSSSGNTFTAPASVPFNATASDADGTISKVEFFNGPTLIGTSTASPYNFTWSNVAAGTYSITAKATDNSGASATSAAVSVTVKIAESPYAGIAISLPGKMEAENYDLGGEGLAYHDADAANQGTAFRTDGVDIESTADAGAGYNVGYIADGEWLKYMVNVTSAGMYNFGFRVAVTGTASAIRVEVDGADVTGSIVLPNTGGWQTWTNVASPNVSLSAGAHTIRLFVVTGGFNINYVNVTRLNQPPTVSLTSPANGAKFTSPASVTLSANAADSDGTIAKVEFFNGTTLIGTSTASPYSFTWNNVATGTYSLTAKATDNSGASTTSAATSISVTDPVILSTPYGGTPWPIPGTIQAENYDNGGEGIAYHDVETANQGNAYRTDGVDIESTSDIGGGYNVGYTADGEWLKYTVNVTAGSYDVSFRVAS